MFDTFSLRCLLRKHGSSLQGLEINFLLFLQLSIAVTAEKGSHKQLLFLELHHIYWGFLTRVSQDVVSCIWYFVLMRTAVVTWVSAAILVLLFLLQRFGTHRIGYLFSPIMLVWFVSTPLVGIYNIVTYYPGVFKALSPQYIIQYFQQNQKNGWVALGGVVLCVTGTSALSRLGLRPIFEPLMPCDICFSI